MAREIWKEIKESVKLPYGRAKGGVINGNELKDAAITISTAGVVLAGGMAVNAVQFKDIEVEEVRVLFSRNPTNPQSGQFAVTVDVFEPCFDGNNDGSGSQTYHRTSVHFPEMEMIQNSRSMPWPQTIPCDLPKWGTRIK